MDGLKPLQYYSRADDTFIDVERRGELCRQRLFTDAQTLAQGKQDGLAQAVFADLKVQRVNLALNDWVDVVLPAELQIIGQLITSRHIRDATSYPGKRVLLRDYVSSAINAAPGVEPHRVRELLLSLVPKSGERPQAISLDELARQTHLDRERTKRLLEYLESDYRIVLRQGHDGGAGPDSPQYRLALDFLAQVIREATGANTSRSKRSEALVESARAERLRTLLEKVLVTRLRDQREAEGKAIGGACRHAGRAIEDCYALNKKADRAAVFAGWREMNDYMRENKIEAVPPQLAADAKGEAKADADKADEPAPAKPAKAAKH